MTDRYRRDVRGRFTHVDVSNTPLAADSEFSPMTGLDVSSGVPEAFAYDTQRRYAPEGDELAQGSRARLRARRPEMVSADDADHTIYGVQGAVMRTAARSSGDPTVAYLVGLEAHGHQQRG